MCGFNIYNEEMGKLSHQDQALLCEQIEQGLIQVKIDSVYPLAQAKLALERSESQLAVGKIVLNVDPTMV